MGLVLATEAGRDGNVQPAEAGADGLRLSAALATLAEAIGEGKARIVVDADGRRTLIQTEAGVTVLRAGSVSGHAGDAPLSDFANIPTPDGLLRAAALEVDGFTAAVLIVGDPRRHEPVPIHVHNGCILGDALDHLGCPGRQAFQRTLDEMRRAGAGVVLYARDDGAFPACCLPGAPARGPLPPGLLGGFFSLLRDLGINHTVEC